MKLTEGERDTKYIEGKKANVGTLILGISRLFVDVAEFQAYRIHPDHVSLVAGELKEFVECK